MPAELRTKLRHRSPGEVFALLAVLAVAIAGPAPARANCARPVTYEVLVAINTVTVQPWNFEQRGCGGAEVMLRQEVATGDTVQLAGFCGQPQDPSDGAPFVDECVAAGLYRYGFATPYPCAGSACGTFRFGEVDITAPLDTACERSAGNAAPTPVAPVGWTAGDRQVCSYGKAGDVWVWGLGCGCGTAPAGAGAVLAGDALAAALGLALLRRRRVRRP